MIPPVGASWRLEKRIEGASPASWRYAREQWRGLDWRLFVCGKEMKKQTSRLAGGADPRATLLPPQGTSLDVSGRRAGNRRDE